MSTKTQNEIKDSMKKAQRAEQILRRPPQTGTPPPEGTHRLTFIASAAALSAATGVHRVDTRPRRA